MSLDMEFLNGLVELCNQTKNREPIPIGIEVNQRWLNMHIALGNIHKSEWSNGTLSLFKGLPMYTNDDIETYRFIYESIEPIE